jgi:hypothetical protein
MVLAVSDVVAVHREQHPPSVVYQGQPPMMGVVAVPAGAPLTHIEIAWYDGKYESIMPDSTIDKILTPSAAVLFGVVVNFSAGGTKPYPGQEYTGVVVQLYQRDLNGDGTDVTGDQALIRCLDNGLYFEVPAADCTLVAGR